MQGLWKYLKEGATGFASGSDVGVRERGGQRCSGTPMGANRKHRVVSAEVRKIVGKTDLGRQIWSLVWGTLHLGCLLSLSSKQM